MVPSLSGMVAHETNGEPRNRQVPPKNPFLDELVRHGQDQRVAGDRDRPDLEPARPCGSTRRRRTLAALVRD
jgi:hypothetical protein